MDWEISVQTHAARFDAALDGDRLNVYTAAKVLGCLKRAKYSHQSEEEEESDRSTALVSRRSAARRGERPPLPFPPSQFDRPKMA